MTGVDRVTMVDVRARGWCVPAAREFCNRYQLDWRTFVKEGLPYDVMAATGDAVAFLLIEDAKKRSAGDGRG